MTFARNARTLAATTPCFAWWKGRWMSTRWSRPGFRGRYFVLKGHLSPLDGLGPEAIGIPQLMARIEEAGTFTEVILATNPTVEGEATAHYIAQLLSNKGLIASRIAHGVPLGGELELVDGGTLAHSFAGRKPISL